MHVCLYRYLSGLLGAFFFFLHLHLPFRFSLRRTLNVNLGLTLLLPSPSLSLSLSPIWLVVSFPARPLSLSPPPHLSCPVLFSPSGPHPIDSLFLFQHLHPSPPGPNKPDLTYPVCLPACRSAWLID
ncbi:hypothetical protein LY76DRAFT_86111 [Colletotrichum caudatum]|nr:hypothetical protein LY76DRAFT_86111 [Colletotrichum caudatum]